MYIVTLHLSFTNVSVYFKKKKKKKKKKKVKT